MRSYDKNKQGSLVLEFALVIGLLLVPLLAGIWDAAQFIDLNQVLTRAAREGVVMASRGEDPAQTVRDYVEASGISADDLVVTVTLGQDDPVVGQEVSVALNYNFSSGTIYPWDDILPDGLKIVAYAKVE